MLLSCVDKSYGRLLVVELQAGQNNPGTDINPAAGQPKPLTCVPCKSKSVGELFPG